MHHNTDAVRLRDVPAPFEGMISISTDIDHTKIETFRETHRFLNTCSETSIGSGLGLDVSNSMWVFKPARQRTVAYFNDSDGDNLTPFAQEIIYYAQQGWIDTLHTYGNFSNSSAKFSRDHAKRALSILDESNLHLSVWVNHGNKNNIQNIGREGYMLGDEPESLAYHADILREYGVEYHWRSAAHRPDLPVLHTQTLKDGSTVFGFDRFQWRALQDAKIVGSLLDLKSSTQKSLLHVWLPRALPYQLANPVLDSVAAAHSLCVMGQHLGSILPMLIFDRSMAKALRRLKEYQDRGIILIARTSRLLHYNRVRDYLNFTATRNDHHVHINITEVDDPVRGRWEPTINDLRGITFEVPGKTEIRIAGRPVPDAEITASSHTCGIRWFEPDVTDYTERFVVERKRLVTGSAIRKLAPHERTAESLDHAAPPQGIELGEYRAAITYAKGRYCVGLQRYIAAFEKMGFTDFTQGLDIGCGVGQWSMAFLQNNQKVRGFDISPSFISIARHVAEYCGVSDRAEFKVENIETMEVAPESVQCAWSHSVLMYVDFETVITRVSDLLCYSGHFYGAYTGAAGRVEALAVPLLKEDIQRARAQANISISACAFNCGLYSALPARVRMLSFADLLRVCRVMGLTYIGRPGVEDGSTYRGMRTTFDFLVTKTTSRRLLLDALLDGQAIETGWAEDLEKIVSSGAPGYVSELIQRLDPGHVNAELLDLYVRCLIKGGRSAEDFEERKLPESTLALYWHSKGNINKALDLYTRTARSVLNHMFLIGVCHLRLENWAEAKLAFAESLDRGVNRIGSLAGTVCACLNMADISSAREAFDYWAGASCDEIAISERFFG